MHDAEALQMKLTLAVGGKRGLLTDLVTAVANAELTLNTVVAVRDRVISAYQSIIGMSISFNIVIPSVGIAAGPDS